MNENLYVKLRTLPVPPFLWPLLFVCATAVAHTYLENPYVLDAVLLLLAGAARGLDVKWEQVVAIADDLLAREDDGEAAGIARARSATGARQLTAVAPVRPRAASQVRRWLLG